MTPAALRIATRASNLALWQANHIAALLRERHPELEVSLVHVSTQGDRDRVEPLRQFGGLGVFTREVQRVVLDGSADLAVHSLKDLPTAPCAGLVLACVPERASRFDALVLPANAEPIELDSLPEQARVGTGSPRRQAQLWNRRPDLQLTEIRGNVETRLRKLDEGEYEAVVLAEAGLTRLGLADRITARLEPPAMFPAVAQGALGIECRENDESTRSLLAELTHPETLACAAAERALLSALRAGCHAPLGALCRAEGDALELAAVILSLDGRERLELAATGLVSDPSELGRRLAEEFRLQGAERLLGEPR